jgi:hypothetical protein
MNGGAVTYNERRLMESMLRLGKGAVHSDNY